jgi:hypothetical protein
MKDTVQTVIVAYAILVSVFCVWLIKENNTLEQNLTEEIELKYECSTIIDSLTEKLHDSRYWYEIYENELK